MTTTHQHSRYLTLGMMLAATNMRLPITMMPGLISSLKRTLGLPSSMAGLLTTIPLLTFAIMSPLIAHWGRRFGNELTLVGIGTDGGNVLIPAIIKDNFPTKIPVATSQYTLSMLLVGSLGTGLSGVLAAHWSLPLTMAVLSVIGLINLVVWLPNLKYNHRAPTVAMTASDGQSTATHGSVWRRPLAWVVTAFFGLQALVYYSLLTWLPTVFVAHGFSLIVAGNLVTVMQLSGLPMSYLVPATSGHRRGVWAMIMVVGVGFIAGIGGILLSGTNFWVAALSCVLLGLGSGAAFSLAVVFFTQKTTNGFETADLSGMAQSAGYLLAAVGPVLFGWLGGQLGWGPVLWLAIILSALLALSGSIIFQHATIYE
ncbi:MFS transporter [Lactiplantibacillus plantarum]|nr:MFS transporter [Lactiplantibacillus plantarum]